MDSDISLHAVELTGLPEHHSVQEASTEVREIFEKLFTQEKVIQVRVEPKLDDLYQKAKELQSLRETVAYY
jgi:hypothetical protein